MNDRLKDILTRAGKTFFQAFLATATVQLMAIAGSGSLKVDIRSLAVTVGLPAMAAGFSAIQNALFPQKTEAFTTTATSGYIEEPGKDRNEIISYTITTKEEEDEDDGVQSE